MVEQRQVSDESRPSYDRRKQLRDAGDGVPTVSNFFPIERYYDASDKVLESFTAAFEARQLDNAYVYGKRYSNFYAKGITEHDYYMSKNSEARRNQANRRLGDVVTKLELIATWMDAEELEKERKRKALIQRQKEEREKRQRELDQKRISDLQKRIQKQKQSTANGSSVNLEESALAKLQRLSQPQGIQLPPSEIQKHDERRRKSKSRVHLNVPAEPDGQLLSQIQLGPSSDLPPPMLPPSEDGPSPPSYQAVINHSSYFGPSMDASPTATSTHEKKYPSAPSYDHAGSQVKKKRPQKQLPIRKHIEYASSMHRKYRQDGKIQVSPLRTYQGRVNGSTNGCTVISACVVSKHMETRGGVSDSQIQSVIDSECIPLLSAIRRKLGLGGASLIVPSDVHDHLVDHKFLFQHKFAGVAGGNITDPSHLGELLNLLSGEQGKTSHLKAGATLFFREHVISIVKFPRSATEAIYDMIDSLPTCNGRGSRTRCHSIEALKVHLEHYCAGKFSEHNIKYIEQNRWDEVMADFDPRVFQSFVWADLPKPKP